MIGPAIAPIPASMVDQSAPATSRSNSCGIMKPAPTKAAHTAKNAKTSSTMRFKVPVALLSRCHGRHHVLRNGFCSAASDRILGTSAVRLLAVPPGFKVRPLCIPDIAYAQ